MCCPLDNSQLLSSLSHNLPQRNVIVTGATLRQNKLSKWLVTQSCFKSVLGPVSWSKFHLVRFCLYCHVGCQQVLLTQDFKLKAFSNERARVISITRTMNQKITRITSAILAGTFISVHDLNGQMPDCWQVLTWSSEVSLLLVVEDVFVSWGLTVLCQTATKGLFSLFWIIADHFLH